MARRKGKPGDHLATSDYTGMTTYASRLQRDFWGSYARKPLKRNLQEIASPLNDPYPVSLYRGPNYEDSPEGLGDTINPFVGVTTRPTSPANMAVQVLGLDPGIGTMEIGTTFIVR